MARALAYEARDAGSGARLASHLRPAHTHWTRLRGLIGTASLADGEGLWIRPCRQVHMFWMRYPIDVVFLDDAGRVVGLVERLQPGRISPKFARAASVLELPAGTIARSGVTPGATVHISRL